MAHSVRLRSLAMLVATAAALLAGPLMPPAVASVSGSYETAVHAYTNKERVKRDKVALHKSSCLDAYAERQARAMAHAQRMFHQELGPILRACKLSQVGENVAFGFTSGKTVSAAWMNSPAHRANLLNSRHRLIGVGAYQDSRGWWYVAQVMGRAR